MLLASFLSSSLCRHFLQKKSEDKNIIFFRKKYPSEFAFNSKQFKCIFLRWLLFSVWLNQFFSHNCENSLYTKAFFRKKRFFSANVTFIPKSRIKKTQYICAMHITNKNRWNVDLMDCNCNFIFFWTLNSFVNSLIITKFSRKKIVTTSLKERIKINIESYIKFTEESCFCFGFFSKIWTCLIFYFTKLCEF